MKLSPATRVAAIATGVIAAGYVDGGSVDSNGNLNQQNDLLVARYVSA